MGGEDPSMQVVRGAQPPGWSLCALGGSLLAHGGLQELVWFADDDPDHRGSRSQGEDTAEYHPEIMHKHIPRAP